MDENGFLNDNMFRTENSGSSRLGDFSRDRMSFDNPYASRVSQPNSQPQQFSSVYQGIPEQNVTPQPAPQPQVQTKYSSNSGTVIYKPKTYDDVKMLIDHLKMNEQIIVDFTTISQTTVFRTLDFLSGAVYALGGSMQKITDNIILFAPSGVTITIPTSLQTK